MKKLLTHLAFLFTAIGTTLVSCEVPWGATKRSGFNIQNNSAVTISTSLSKNYPDTLIPDSNSVRRIILSSGNVFDFTTSDKFSKYFSQLPADTLSIFFISQDSISKYGWKQIQSRYLLLARKDISLKDLEDSDYLITYP